MDTNNVRIGIMGGTFNPIHNGHLIAAEICRTNFNLDEIHFVTSGQPVHKTSEYMASKEDRYEMTVLATAKNPLFIPSSIEINREGGTYSIDTIEAYKRIYPRSSIYFITGSDAIQLLHTWKSIDSLVKLCSFIAVTRAGYDNQSLLGTIGRYQEEYGADILPIEIPPIKVSSTEIRRKIREGNSIDNLVPKAVADYIYNNNLYK